MRVTASFNRPICFTAALTAAVSIILSACQSYQSKPIDLKQSQQALLARTMDDPALLAKLNKLNLLNPAGTAPASWNRAQLLVMTAERNPSLLAARANLREATAGVTTARAAPNVNVGLGTEYQASQNQTSPWLWSITTSVLLDDILQRQLRVQLANTQLRAARMDYAEAVWSVRRELRSALLSLLVARKRADLLATAIEQQLRLIALLQQRITLGESSSADWLTAQQALSNLRALRNQATQQTMSALTKLASTLGVPANALEAQSLQWDSFDAPALPDAAKFTALRDQALLSRSDLEHAVLNYDASDVELRQQLHLQYPQFSLGPGYTVDQGAHKVTFALSFNLPLSGNRGPVAAALAHRDAAAAQVLAVQTTVFSEADSAWRQCSIAAQALDVAREQQRIADQQVSRLQQSLQAGAIDRPSVLTAQINAVTQALSVMEAVSALQQAMGDLEDAVRAPLEGPEQTLGNRLVNGE